VATPFTSTINLQIERVGPLSVGSHFEAHLTLGSWFSHYAFMVTVLAGFFLVGNFEAIDPKIVDIIEMLSTDNLASMILAETLNGLDDLKDGTCHHFKGSPLLLQVVSLALYIFEFCFCYHYRIFFFFFVQMWLYDHLSMLSLPMVRDSTYRPRNYYHRRLAEKVFIFFLEKLTHEDANWILPWWSIDTFIMSTYPLGCVVMAGLSRASYFEFSFFIPFFFFFFFLHFSLLYSLFFCNLFFPLG
jgi:hypothetical protein